MADNHEDEWCGTQEAARRLGVTPAAVRNRIKRRTIEVKPNGNIGRLVRVPRTVPSTDPEPLPSTDPEPVPSLVADLIAELRDRISELQAERASLRQEMAQERATAAQERAAMQEAVSAQVKALTDLIEEMRRDRKRWHAEATARRSWWPWRRSA
jgi:hypothetical protein